MNLSREIQCNAEDGRILRGYAWMPDVPPVAAILILHGMMEHIGRYGAFAEYLSANGVCVFGFDLRGHGKTSPNIEDKGFFADRGGLDLLISDTARCHAFVLQSLADEGISVPFLLMGHSMGSFLTSCYVKRTGARNIDGILLSGTSTKPGPVGFARFLARAQCVVRGPRSEAKLLDRMAFGSYTERIKPKRTDKDWLSTDERVVDAYLLDPECGRPFTAAGYADLFTLLGEIGNKNWTAAVPESVPVALFSGEEDPVGRYGAGPRLLADWFRETGHDVTIRIYADGRHEMLNERQKTKVYEDVLATILAIKARKDRLKGALASGPGEDISSD